MAKAGMGDEILLQKLKSLATPGNGCSSDRDSALAQLGESGLEPGVPPIGLEGLYYEGHQAYKEARAAEIRHDEIANAIWPGSAIGWFSMITSYFLTTFLFMVLLAYLAPAYAPAYFVRWFHKDTAVEDVPAPSAQAHGVRVTLQRVSLGFEQVQAGKVIIQEAHIKQLRILVTIRNDGDKDLNYVTWRALNKTPNHDAGKLIDNRGDFVNRLVYTLDLVPIGGVADSPVRRGETIQDMLVFSEPKQGFNRLDLYLPGKNLGLPDETFILKIPAAYIVSVR